MARVALVLRVAKVRAGGGDYYLEVAAGTGTGIEAAGGWLGSGTVELGLFDAVGSHDLHAVLAGEDPVTGRVLGGARQRVQVAAFDMTFSAPKSVSLLHALAESEVSQAVADSHAGAVGAAMAYVEQRALAVRRRTDSAARPVPTTVEAVAAGFVHRLSRALDPHLHTHVVVANLGRGPEGQWSALDGRGVYAHASATDALYHAHLRHELTSRLGVAWNSLDRGRADITGITPEARQEFSRRATQIATYLAERGDDGARAKTLAGHVTRADKDLFLGADDLRPQWQERARAVGLGPRRLESVLERAPRRSQEREGSGRQSSVVAENVRQLLLGSDRPVTRRDVVRGWCHSLPGGAPAPTVEEAADRFLETLLPERGHGGERHGPGVAERRHQPPSSTFDRADVERSEVSRLLARRGIGPDRSARRSPEVGFGLG